VLSAGDGALQDALARVEDHEDEPYHDEDRDREARDGYYPEGLHNLEPDELYGSLARLVEQSHGTRLSYGEARLEHLYPWVDLRPDRQLASIYSGRSFTPEEAIRGDLETAAFHEAALRERLASEGALGPEAVKEMLEDLEAQAPFNCEHVVPQSWFAKAQPMKADLHHLFACEPNCNSFRGNIPYFQFPPRDETVREHCGRRESDRFEPAEGKGPVARATLYFLLRYPGLIGDEARELQAGRLEVLLRWHRDFPVDDYERHRNAAIFTVQGNRNPLIDHPDWAERIDFRRGFGPLLG
jgi:endonuclease G, mitochondrial